MVHGPVLTRERAPASPARAVSDTMLGERSVPHLFSSFFFSIPESSARPCAPRISPPIFSLSRYFSRSSSSFLRYLSPARVLFFFFFSFVSGETILPLGSSFAPFARARYRLGTYVPDSTLSRIYGSLSLFFLIYQHLTA